MRLVSKSRNELFCCRRRTIRVGLRQYFCYRLLKSSRNDFLLRYIDDAVCIQSEFWNDRKADEGEGHKDADIFRYTMCLEGIVQRLHFRRNALCAFGAHQSGHRKRKFCHDLSICHKRKSAFVFPHSVAGQHHIGIVVPCHDQVMGIMCDARCNGSAFQAEVRFSHLWIGSAIILPRLAAAEKMSGNKNGPGGLVTALRGHLMCVVLWRTRPAFYSISIRFGFSGKAFVC